MKNYLILCMLFAGIAAASQAQDLPGPTANLQVMPSGSYIIAMDNTNQLNGSLFNLKTYGLLVHLLNNQVKLKWIISAGKAKDGIDFTVTTTQLRPAVNSTVTGRSFKAGPFVIFSSDTTGVAALIDGFYAANSLTGSNRPNVFVSTSSVTVDQRYDLSGFKPMAAILSDGGNQGIHQTFMTDASIPSSNYTVVSGLNLLSNCYTFASEPHNSKTGTDVNTAINNIHLFVSSGGNFLAECAAIPNYENNTLGRFQTTTGITVVNTNIGTSVLFPNPDLSYSQFEGVFNGSLTGSVENWQINASGANNEHQHVTGTGANSSLISASVSKLVSGKGGLAFYLGNHNYSTADIQNINGIRMYMNAFLTPAYQVCPSVLPLSFITWKGRLEKGRCYLDWTVGGYQPGTSFEVQRSTNGTDFVTVSRVGGQTNTSAYTYDGREGLPDVYYRIKAIYAGGYRFSPVVQLTAMPVINECSVYSNGSAPVVFYSSDSEEIINLRICTAYGQTVYNGNQTVHPGRNVLAIETASLRSKGLYMVTITTKQGCVSEKFIH